tara:strand:+ start:19340 stop:19930 length:591 start_codon:yes stop_codon:yes gene_type:complete
MNVIEYINGLIEKGNWSDLSSESQSIFLLIIARYKGEPIKLSYREIQTATGVSKSVVKSKLTELVEAGLIVIDPDTNAIKPTAELSDEGLPTPPEGEEPDQEYLDLLEWVREFVASPWGAVLGGAVLYYLIKLWLEYIESQQKANDPFRDWPTFIAEASTNDFGLGGAEKVASKILKKPLDTVIATEWERLMFYER